MNAMNWTCWAPSTIYVNDNIAFKVKHRRRKYLSSSWFDSELFIDIMKALCCRIIFILFNITSLWTYSYWQQLSNNLLSNYSTIYSKRKWINISLRKQMLFSECENNPAYVNKNKILIFVAYVCRIYV